MGKYSGVNLLGVWNRLKLAPKMVLGIALGMC